MHRKYSSPSRSEVIPTKSASRAGTSPSWYQMHSRRSVPSALRVRRLTHSPHTAVRVARRQRSHRLVASSPVIRWPPSSYSVIACSRRRVPASMLSL